MLCCTSAALFVDPSHGCDHLYSTIVRTAEGCLPRANERLEDFCIIAFSIGTRYSKQIDDASILSIVH